MKIKCMFGIYSEGLRQKCRRTFILNDNDIIRSISWINLTDKVTTTKNAVGRKTKTEKLSINYNYNAVAYDFPFIFRLFFGLLILFDAVAAVFCLSFMFSVV